MSLLASGGVAYADAATSPQQKQAQQQPGWRVFRGSGNITPVVNRFRAALGDPLNNNEPKQQPGGRRDINWDGVPANLTNTPNFPGNFFNSTNPNDPPARKRGAAFFTQSGGAFQVSDRNFSDIDPSYAHQFRPFSDPKTFMVLKSNTMEVRFQALGATTPARVRGFGVVFSDVDKNGSARIEFFDSHGSSLGTVTAPKRSDGKGLSFVGVVLNNPRITRARITSGEAALGHGVKDISAGGTKDLVVMDDFIFGEPQAIH